MTRLIYPFELITTYPIDSDDVAFITQSRKTVSDIISGRDKRLLVVIGPCAIHDAKAAREYAERLVKLHNELADKLFIVMRVYIERSNQRIGWKGLLNNPDITQKFQLKKGFERARHLLCDLTKQRLPVAVEYLDLLTPQYFSDLITWGEMGTSIVESQTHREMASGISCPIGFKSANIEIAIDAITASAHQHMFWGIDQQGQAARYQTAGNHNCHVVLTTNSAGSNVANDWRDALNTLEKKHLPARLMLDLSSNNPQFEKQLDQINATAAHLKNGNDSILGVMIKSNLVGGAQPVDILSNLTYGQSITDVCLGWQQSEKILRYLAASS